MFWTVLYRTIEKQLISCERLLLYITGNDTGEVAQLSKKLIGPWAELIAKLFSFIILLGANIVYWILMSNFLYYSVGYIHGKAR